MVKLHYYTNNGNVYNYIRQIAIVLLAETKIYIFYFLLFWLLVFMDKRKLYEEYKKQYSNGFVDGTYYIIFKTE